MDSVRASLPVVLSQLVLGPADLAGDVVLGPGSGVARPDLQARHLGEMHPVKSRRTKLSFIFLPEVSLTSRDMPSSAVFLVTMFWMELRSSEPGVAGTNITAS